MNIAFVLPNIPRKPGGGAKIVFQYAEYIAQMGNEVTIYYLTDRFLKGKSPIFIRKKIGELYARCCPNWYDLGVRHKAAFDVDDVDDNHDVIIATAVMTAFFVDKIESDCKKFYFIQGFETFYTTEDEVYKSYLLPLKKIVISKWLQAIVKEKTGELPIYIPNGIDLSVFKLTNPIEDRKKHSLAFHYREATLKGCEYAIKTVEILQKKYPDLDLHVIGNVECPTILKRKCNYYKNIKEKEVARINNMVRVFLSTSIEEGFGLPGLEAMACGCGLCTSNYTGAMEYAKDGINSLVSPIMDYEKMAQNVISLFEDELKLINMSNNAMRISNQFDNNNSRVLFYRCILENED